MTLLLVASGGAAPEELGARQSRNPEAAGTGPRLTDAEFFAALELSRPDLAAVRAAVERQDWDAATRAFVQHFRMRKMPRWHFQPGDPLPEGQRPAVPETAAADRILAHELTSISIPYQFGPDIDWSYNPTTAPGSPHAANHEWTWQLSRHGFWRDLGRAYRDTGDEKYAREYVAQVRDWIEDNPVPDTAQNAPYSRWRTLEAGIRMAGPWFDAFYYFLPSPVLDDRAVVTLMKSMVEHARYLERNFSRGGNWVTMEARGLFHVGVMLPEFRESADWRRTATERLYAEIEAQVYPDGTQIELSTGYHQSSLRNFVEALRIARLNEVAMPSDYLAKLERMYHYNLYAAMPNGSLPGLNDAGYTDIRGSMREAAEFFPQRSDFHWAATVWASAGGRGEGSGAKPNAGALIINDQKATPLPAPSLTSVAFPYAGQFVMRSGWDRDARYLLFDAGPFGYSHQHEDKLSFVIHAFGSNLLVDPGNYQYDASPWRKYVVGPYAHNIVNVDGLPQHRRGLPREGYVVDEPLPHRWVTAPEFDYAAGLYDDGFGTERAPLATQRRHILFVKSTAASQPEGGRSRDSDFWIVVDAFTPAADGEHTYEAMFHLDTQDVAQDARNRSVTTRNPSGGDLTIIPLVTADLQLEIVKGQEQPIVQGWMPDGLLKVRPIPTALYRHRAAGPTHMAYVFAPSPAGEPSPVTALERIPVTDASGQDAPALAVRVRLVDGISFVAVIADRARSLRVAGRETTAAVTLIREGERPQQWILDERGFE